MIGADHPDGAIGLQDAAALAEPGSRERVVVGKAAELVPRVVHAVDDGIVGTQKFALELQVVGRIGEDEIDGAVGQLAQSPEAITGHHAVQR